MTTTHSYDPTKPLLEVTDLKAHFPIKSGILRRTVGHVRAVDGVSLTVNPGETVGLVGESGCGKTTIGRAIAGLVPATDGSVLFDDMELVGCSRKELRPVRRELQYVFQDPYSSLNPSMSIFDIVAEPHRIQGIFDERGGTRRVDELLDSVGIPKSMRNRDPSELSGGQRQRVSIARSLSLDPKMLVLDEPVSALDVSIQAQIVNLLKDLQERFSLAYLFISHDLSVVRHVADRIMVMYLGRIVEQGANEDIYANPAHPYTDALWNAVPVPDPSQPATWQTSTLAGEIPSPANPPSGCTFHPRCPKAQADCQVDVPVIGPRPGFDTLAACHHPGRITPREVEDRSEGLDGAPDATPTPVAISEG